MGYHQIDVFFCLFVVVGFLGGEVLGGGGGGGEGCPFMLPLEHHSHFISHG